MDPTLHIQPAGYTLLVDADDTLWENNIYFERVVGEYCALLAAHGIGPDEARGRLLAIERVRTKTNGYGIDNFAASMAEACRQLLGGPAEHEVTTLGTLCHQIREQDLELLPGVAETLEELSQRHRVILMTKGDVGDQRHKIARSGLERFFHDVEIVREKNTATYLQTIVRHEVDADRGWMIGNSPRSDVLPALDAGLGVVYIPHPATWVLELDDLPTPRPERFIQIDRFDDLLRVF
ncbi:MAG: HAD hydrolase-like protein [Vicinamibacteraceae bacterium]|nr:HAD hydrolase-like protein [Vicinamibacteraceae bacterium]